MHSLATIHRINEDAVLKKCNCLKWDRSLKTLVDPRTREPITDRPFRNKLQALSWLRVRGFEDIVVI